MIHKNRGTEPPCWDCFPVLLEENKFLFQVYKLVAGQVIVAGMGEVLDLNICAVDVAFDAFDVPRELRNKYLHRLISMFRARLAERKEEQQEDG
jgi:hypothetical protein